MKEPTRYRSQNVPSILDLILTNEENMISNLQYKPGLGKSDHLVLDFTFNCYIGSSDPPSKKLIFFKGNYKNISEKIHECNWEQNIQELSLSEARETLTENLIQLVEENVPELKVSNKAGRKNPYLRRQCMVAIKENILNGKIPT